MSTYTITTKSGAVITAELEHVDGGRLEVYQGSNLVGSGWVSAQGRIEDCDARLGAADGSETEAAYEALEAEIAKGMR